MPRWTDLTAFSQSRRGSHCDGSCEHRSTADQLSMRHFDRLSSGALFGFWEQQDFLARSIIRGPELSSQKYFRLPKRRFSS
jgi:hypothetical protein